MTKYMVRPGCRFGVGKKYGPGDVVELEPAHAASFLDLLEPVPAEPVVAAPKPTKGEPKTKAPARPAADDEASDGTAAQ